MFIVFEGCEGSGKTTQCKLLWEYFVSKDIKVKSTREPGGTKEAEAIRHLLMQNDLLYDSLSEVLLYFASRRQHIVDVIAPYLRNHYVVICDRFVDSSIAYQHYAMGADIDFIKYLINSTVAGIKADLTILLDIEPKIGLSRSIARDSSQKNNLKYENKSLIFHQKVREGFLKIADNNSDYLIIDANDDPQAIHKKIVSSVNEVLCK